MPPTSSTRRYAEAAFEIALRDDNVERWLEQLDTAARITADDELVDRLSDPSVPFDVRARALESALGPSSCPSCATSCCC